jgi:hypothetical protein
MSAQKEDQELEEKQGGAITPRVSGDKNLPAGFDGVEEGDIKMSRLAIGQGLSGVVIDGKAKMGDLYQTITNEVFGESVEFIPLFMFKSRARFDNEKGLVMMSRDNETVTMAIDEYAQYLGKPVEEVPGVSWEKDQPPTFGEVFNFPLLLVSQLKQFPISLSLMKTAIKPAKAFLSMARYSGEDMFARVYSIRSEIVKGPKGTYALPVIEFSRRCTDEEYAAAKATFDKIYRRKKDIDVELEEEAAADPNE